MDGLWRDLRIAGRTYWKQPGFTIVAVLILALGIGANTAIYTLVDAVVLRQLPVARPGDLYRLGDTNNCCVESGTQRSYSLYSYPLFRYLADHTPELTLMAFQVNVQPLSVRRIGMDAAAQPATGEFVSGSYFTTLGVAPAAGRTLAPEDDRPGATAAAVMSYRTWRDRYARDPAVVGASFALNAQPVTIVGVAAPGFFGETLRPDPPDFWIALGAEPALRGTSSLLASASQNWLYAIGRLQKGVLAAPAQAHVSAELRDWLAVQPDLSPRERALLAEQHIVLTPGGAGVSTTRLRYSASLGLLAVVSALVLLIACANLANLLLARTQPFQFALRAALGASRGQLIRQMLAGGVLLAGAGGAAGILVAYAGSRAIVAAVFNGSHYVPIDPTPSLAVLAAATLLSLLTGVIFTAMPALVLSKANPIEALRGAGRATGDRAALPRQALVVLQVAVSLVLLVGAGLLTASLRRIETQDFGFQTEGRFLLRIDPSLAGYTPERLAGLYTELQDRLMKIPGVVAVSLSQYSPMEGNNWSSEISIEGRPVDPTHREYPSWLRVSPHYFETIGTRLLRGRAIDDRDTATAPHVVVINRAMAKKFFPTSEALGQHFGIGDASHALDYEIVGVVDDAKYVAADEPAWPTFFLPLLQTVAYQAEDYVSMQTRSILIHDIELRVSGGLANLEAALRRTIADIDPNLPMLSLVPFDEQVGQIFNQRRVVAELTALYGQLALLLAAVGLYGVTAHHVARRTAEIGIRMALGADRRAVLTMVLRRALVQTALGLAIGLPIALIAGRGLASQLYGVTGHDARVVASAVLVLAASALLAALVPARRAASLDPIRALRTQ
jgi:predicted permease